MAKITITLTEQHLENLEKLKAQNRFQGLKPADIVTQLIAENLDISFEMPDKISEDKNDLRQFKVGLYLTQDQVSFLETQGKQYGFNTFAKVIKYLVLSQLNPNKTLSPDGQQALREYIVKINAIGNNLNQIAKTLHSTTSPDNDTVTKIHTYIEKALPVLKEHTQQALALVKQGNTNAK